jgi:hypothetical protein
VVVITKALCCFLEGEFPLWLGHGPFAMHPLRLNPVEPRALGRQLAQHQATAAVALDTPGMRLDPGPHCAAAMPRGMVPDDQEGLLRFLGQLRGQPAQELGRDATDWATIDNAQQHGLCLCPQHAIARPGFGLQVLLVRLVWEQA